MCQSLVEKRNQDLETPEGDNSVLYWAGTSLCYTIIPENRLFQTLNVVITMYFSSKIGRQDQCCEPLWAHRLRFRISGLV